MNAHLLRSFTKEDIWLALKQIHPHKALGPDGFAAYIFSQFLRDCGVGCDSVLLVGSEWSGHTTGFKRDIHRFHAKD